MREQESDQIRSDQKRRCNKENKEKERKKERKERRDHKSLICSTQMRGSKDQLLVWWKEILNLDFSEYRRRMRGSKNSRIMLHVFRFFSEKSFMYISMAWGNWISSSSSNVFEHIHVLKATLIPSLTVSPSRMEMLSEGQRPLKIQNETRYWSWWKTKRRDFSASTSPKRWGMWIHVGCFEMKEGGERSDLKMQCSISNMVNSCPSIMYLMVWWYSTSCFIDPTWRSSKYEWIAIVL